MAEKQVTDPFLAEDLAKVRDTIRRLREHRGLTQWDVARELGITQANVSRVEAGGAGNVRVETLGRIAALLGGRLRVSVEERERV